MSRATASSDSAIADILHVARALNEADELTGLLLSDGARFLQVIEGPEQRLRACFERILTDERHYDVVIVSDQPVAARQFGSWAMRHHDRQSVERSIFKGNVARDVETVTDAALKAMFIGFAALSR